MMVIADTQGVVGIASLTCEDAKTVQAQKGEPGAAAIAEKAAKELTQYAAGERREFDVPLSLDRLAPFQRAVLAETAKIPMRSVATYGEIAARIGKPKSARAVGGALARNPIGIIIPCHRVVAHDGRLHGFSSPEGIAGKARLLQHEGVSVEKDRVILRKESGQEER
jgi:methylated-DNA-[protein]-cysteine S-methyltransferase